MRRHALKEPLCACVCTCVWVGVVGLGWGQGMHAGSASPGSLTQRPAPRLDEAQLEAAYQHLLRQGRDDGALLLFVRVHV